MWYNWFPWRFVLSKVARSHGFIDPIALLSRLHQFAQPSEVTEPIELLRAGVVFHARGLINARTIQHNLDWIWPFWIERQFEPGDPAFIPRAFSITHVNLTHRNWTAVGVPDCDSYPIVDPRGLVSPFLDGWSLDAWIVGPQASLFPSRAADVEQHLELEPSLQVLTQSANKVGSIASSVTVEMVNERPVCQVRWRGESARGAAEQFFVVALRPANPEGVRFIQAVDFSDRHCSWRVDDEASIELSPRPDRVCMSDYRSGDVAVRLIDAEECHHKTCDVGLCTSAALYRLGSGQAVEVTATIPLTEGSVRSKGNMPQASVSHKGQKLVSAANRWHDALEGSCEIQTPDEQINFLFDAASRNLVLHAPGDIYPGPSTYKRFWFRDAAFIGHALLNINQIERVARAVERFPERQTATGFFHSQQGEWDSNGAALWLLDRFRRLSGRRLGDDMLRAVRAGARWIVRKRVRGSEQLPHNGLMPAGFSAEHLGPNDYYYWDDFWSAAGLRAAADMVRSERVETSAGRRHEDQALHWSREAEDLLAAIDRSLDQTAARRDMGGIPASPYRRFDSGAIGSLAGSYPLQLWNPNDPRLLATLDFLLDRCLVHGGFFQDMIHSGINAYLTLQIAQCLLRSGQDHQQRYLQLLKAVQDLASPTGQWPEAIHPHTGGGCMGDGQHIWAAAEWVLMVRNLFVREESSDLILGSGLPLEWLDSHALQDRPLQCGPTPTPYGPITVRIDADDRQLFVRWEAEWRNLPASCRIELPGCEPIDADPRAGEARVPFDSARNGGTVANYGR